MIPYPPPPPPPDPTKYSSHVHPTCMLRLMLLKVSESSCEQRAKHSWDRRNRTTRHGASFPFSRSRNMSKLSLRYSQALGKCSPKSTSEIRIVLPVLAEASASYGNKTYFDGTAAYRRTSLEPLHKGHVTPVSRTYSFPVALDLTLTDSSSWMPTGSNRYTASALVTSP